MQMQRQNIKEAWIMIVRLSAILLKCYHFEGMIMIFQ